MFWCDRPTWFESQQRTRTTWHLSVILISSLIFFKTVISSLDAIFPRSTLVVHEYKLWSSTLLNYSVTCCNTVSYRDHATTRQEMCVWPNIEVRSCNHCYSGKAISFTCSECMFAALAVQHKVHTPNYIAIWYLSYFTAFLYIISKTARFSGGKVIENKMCGLIYSATYIWSIFHSKNNSARYYNEFDVRVTVHRRYYVR
jgi:hypothetical protein